MVGLEKGEGEKLGGDTKGKQYMIALMARIRCEI
jgi:hypothetical protein